MEEKASDHDDVEDDVLRAKEFRRGAESTLVNS